MHVNLTKFDRRVEKTRGCWYWKGLLANGYGVYGNKENRWAHRVAYRLAYGDIPLELEIDHICRVRHCVRPEHLRAVTHKENCQNR